MRRSIDLKSSELENDKISISIVNDYKDGDFKNFYRILDLKKPVENVGLIGVESLDQFAIKIDKSQNTNISFALYLDGVDVNQKNGIRSLSELKENERNKYENHNQFICKQTGNNKTFFINRYSQKSSKNREFIFTDIPNTGINENLIGDPSKLSRIEIYFWAEDKTLYLNLKEEVSSNRLLFAPIRKSLSNDKPMKIGAGKETNQKFQTTDGLKNPVYLGKIMLIYVNEKFIKIKGNSKIPKNDEFDFNDPMDLIPQP